MQTFFGLLTIGATPVQIPAGIVPQVSSFAGGPRVAKLIVQQAPGNTGNIKIGKAGVGNDNTTPGITIDPSAIVNPDGSLSPGGTWTVESYQGINDIVLSQYFFQGSHAGDVLMYEVHVAS